jgi:hypothetical protein
MIELLSGEMKEMAEKHGKDLIEKKNNKFYRDTHIKLNAEFKEINEEFRKTAILFSIGSDPKILRDAHQKTFSLMFGNTNTQELNQYLANLETAAFSVAGQKFDLTNLDQCNEISDKIYYNDQNEKLDFDCKRYIVLLEIIRRYQSVTCIYRTYVKKICEESDLALYEEEDAA